MRVVLRSLAMRPSMVCAVSLLCSTPLGVVGCGSTGDAGKTSAPATSGPKFVQGMSVTGVAMFQATKANLVTTDDNGNTAHVGTANAPVIDGRPGQLRVYVQLGDGFQPHDVTGELHVADASGADLFTLTDTKTISANSSDGDTGSTFNFVLENDQVVPAGAQFRVALIDDTNGKALGVKNQSDAIAARWPQDGTLDSFNTKEVGDAIKVVVVPIQYDADGSGRLPDTSDTQMAAFKNRIMQFYPVKRVDFAMHAAWPWKSPALEPADQNAWSQLITSLAALRASDKAPSDVFYFALFDSYSSWIAYLSAGGQNGAIIGVGDARGPTDPAYRNVAVVGYTGTFTAPGAKISGADTLPQELAHTVGRLHAPCAPGGQIPYPVDTKYPYATAAIGTWGYDVLAKTFIDPSSGAKDYMSYCFQSIWTSDYTYNALAQQMSKIYAPPMSRTVAPLKKPYRQFLVSADGALVPQGTVLLENAPAGEPRVARFRAADGRVLASETAYETALENLGTRVVVVPEHDAVDRVEIAGVGAARLSSR